MSNKVIFCLIVSLLFVFPSTALAGDGATVIFKSGKTIYLNSGFKQIESGLNKSSGNSSNNVYVKLELAESPIYINLDTVAIVCRDNCKSMKLIETEKDEK